MRIPFMYSTLYSLFIKLSRHFAREARMFGAAPTAVIDGKRGSAVPHIRRATRNLLTNRNRIQDQSINMGRKCQYTEFNVRC